MLQVMRLAPLVLGESAALVRDFLRHQIHSTGGFCDRAGAPDLYYTVFGLEGLFALGESIPPTATLEWLKTFGDGATLDFVHRCSLARCYAILNAPAPLSLADRIEEYRTPDGGYHADRAANTATVYACFLAAGAFEDLGRVLLTTDAAAMLASCETLRARDGGYANQPNLPRGATPATAAAAILFRALHHCEQPGEIASSSPRANVATWLLERQREGGFVATPGTPVPDLLSTATALHALAGMGIDLAPLAEAGLNFVDSLWTNRGGFFGHWADDIADCEYTWYALLALGHLR